MRKRRYLPTLPVLSGAVGLLAALVTALPATAQPLAGIPEWYDYFGRAVATGDFDGDGYDDLAVGVDGEDVGDIQSAGAVNVIYGSPNQLTGTGNQIWHPGAGGIDNAAEALDRFGYSLAAGDFDGDGYDDLAVGVPYEDLGSIRDAGAVTVIYGSPGGLIAAGNQTWHQDSPGIEDHAEGDDRFGSSLAAGDFDGDGYDDLAVGVPGEDVSIVEDAGAVNVLYGTHSGLKANDDQFWHQNSPGVPDTSESEDIFGLSLAAGDFNGDSRDDLAIGVTAEVVGSTADAGAVALFHGSSDGLVPMIDFWHPGYPGVGNALEPEDFYGHTLAAGDFDGDGYDDLAVGIPYEGVGSESDAGAVDVLYGTPFGLRTDRYQSWHQDSPGIRGSAEQWDDFGYALAAGDFDGDGYDDLAVGVPNETSGSTTRLEGAVAVLFGTSNGLKASSNQLWHQDSPGISDHTEDEDSFGRSLAAGDFDGDGYDDLAVGVPYEDFGSMRDAGAVNAIYGWAGGLTATGNQFWHQGGDGAPRVAGAGPSRALAETDDGAAEDAEPADPAASTEAPGATALLAPAPNPARGTAALRFTLAAPGPVRLAVYDAMGREVAVLADGPQEAGTPAVTFDGAALPAGTYLIRLTAEGRAQTQRLTLLRGALALTAPPRPLRSDEAGADLFRVR